MAMAFPTPQQGQPQHVTLADIPLQVIEGTYVVEPAERFGEKISTGDLRYADFNPYESAESVGSLAGGYGLSRYSDLPDQTLAHTYYLEATNVDCRGPQAILAPALTTDTLTGGTQAVVWLGEFATGGTTYWVAVAGQKVFRCTVLGTWVDTGIALSANAVQGAVGVFGANLIIGFGSAATAQYTSNLSAAGNIVNDAAANLYVYAVTADRANAYIAGGTSAANTNTVMASTTGITYTVASTVTCGDTASTITGLAPGGGLDVVLVIKNTELGAIDTTSTYRILMPFDSRLSTNGRGMRWWLGRGGREQNGPMLVVFPKDRGPWVYEPSGATSGKAENIAPWANENFRPPTIRGRVTCFLGTARWLFYAITTGAGTSYVLARDARTGATHSLLSLGANACLALGVTSLLSTNPQLFIGTATNLQRLVLPLDGDSPLDDANCRFGSSGVLDLASMDLNFPDEAKIPFAVRVVADNLSTGHRAIQVSYSLDGGSYAVLGTASVSPVTEIPFDAPLPNCKRINLRLTFSSDDSSETPIHYATSLRWRLNPTPYRTWSFAARVPAGASRLPSDDLLNPATLIQEVWQILVDNVPVAFRDQWANTYNVSLLGLQERTVYNDVQRVHENALVLRLLETGGATLPLLSTTYAGPASRLFFPFRFPWSVLSSATLNAADTISNGGTATTYPIWTLYGPMTLFSTTNFDTGATLTLTTTLGGSQSVVINCHPSKQTAVRNDGTDLSGSVTGTYWGFQPGANSITLVMTGASGSSRVVLQRTAA